jgi:hypothetical protein
MRRELVGGEAKEKKGEVRRAGEMGKMVEGRNFSGGEKKSFRASVFAFPWFCLCGK